tara:strand:- start:10175 stop:12961 length:2787 start_codon:yes stop_codon:yes gene_type:complete
MRLKCAAAMLVATFLTAPAIAGEEVLYDAAPAWIAAADLEAAIADSTTNMVIFDQQLRIEDGQLWDYSDRAIRMSSAQDLTMAGTVGASWQPDKGDLIVHEISILRDGEVIDMLDAGERLEVIRREQALEQRMLDGVLTAMLAVPGLQVGDVLRVRYSVTREEQALGDEVESISYLPHLPDFRPGFARVRASWKDGAAVHFQAAPNVELAPPTLDSGYNWLELALPLAEGDEFPSDAPLRYRRPSLLQLTTFADWKEVSRAQAPLYDVEGVIAPGGELAQRVQAIMAEYSSPLDRAVAALEMVQEEIGYLANGLDGGNYLPQEPQETWDLRYGDCKAKTKLLLALLDGLGIEAEPVLVHTEIGAALPEMLPSAGLFNHIIVRALIDGDSYWLDGTSQGANVAVAGNVPPFGYALPLQAEGAELVPIVQTLPRTPDTAVAIDVDQRAGIDIPVLAKVRFDVVGPVAAFINATLEQADEDQRIDLANRMIYAILGVHQVVSADFAKGSDNSEIAITVDSLMTSPTRFEGATGKVTPELLIADFSFSPDRSRRQWRDIPVDIGPPSASEVTYRLHLPEGKDAFQLLGTADLDETIAGRRLHRRASLDGNMLTVIESIVSDGGEVAVDQITEERRKAAALGRNPLRLEADDDVARRWKFAGADDRSLLEPVEQAYATLIARDPDEVMPYLNRANLRIMTYDFAGAYDDLTKAIALDGAADTYARRSQALADMLDREASRDDLAEAYALDPGPGRAMALAEALADTGAMEEARALLEEQYGDEDVRQALALALAELDAREGLFDDGLARIDALLDDDPNDAWLLNSKCWYMGTWNIKPAQALDLCVQAVEKASNPGAALDSRAMAYLRNGQIDAALADANAALALIPAQTATLLLRGIIRREAGDTGGQEDIDEALARSPAIGKVYRRFGFAI